MVQSEELVIANLRDALTRVKAMVDILYTPETLTPEKVQALAQLARMSLGTPPNVESIEKLKSIQSLNGTQSLKSVDDLKAVENVEVFDSLHEVATFLIDQILNNSAINDCRDLINDISSADNFNK